MFNVIMMNLHPFVQRTFIFHMPKFMFMNIHILYVHEHIVYEHSWNFLVMVVHECFDGKFSQTSMDESTMNIYKIHVHELSFIESSQTFSLWTHSRHSLSMSSNKCFEAFMTFKGASMIHILGGEKDFVQKKSKY